MKGDVFLYSAAFQRAAFLLAKKDMTDNIEIINVKPHYIAQKCPVCNGWGTVSFKQITCHACEGRGFILIPVEKER